MFIIYYWLYFPPASITAFRVFSSYFYFLFLLFLSFSCCCCCYCYCWSYQETWLLQLMLVACEIKTIAITNNLFSKMCSYYKTISNRKFINTQTYNIITAKLKETTEKHTCWKGMCAPIENVSSSPVTSWLW